METKMIVRGERDRSAAVIVLLLLGAMLLAGALVLALVWSGGAGIEKVERQAVPAAAQAASDDDAFYTERTYEAAAARANSAPAAAGDSIPSYYASRAMAEALLATASEDDAFYTERYYEAAAAREAAKAVVEMERYAAAMAAEREFTYTTAGDVAKGRRAAEAFWQTWEAAGSGVDSGR